MLKKGREINFFSRPRANSAPTAPSHNPHAPPTNPRPTPHAHKTQPALKPLLKKSPPTFLTPNINPIGPHLYRVSLHCIPLPIHIPPAFQIKLNTTPRPNNLTPPANLSHYHPASRWRTSVPKP